MTGVGGSPASGRIFMALGTLVVALVAFRFARGGLAAITAWDAASAAAGAPSSFRFVRAHGALLAVTAVVALIALLAVVSAVLTRRPWARPAAIGLLAVTGAAAVAVAVFQLSALAGGPAVPPETREIGYGPLLSFWRIGGAVASILLALFCAASLRRLASEEMRREFEGKKVDSSEATPPGTLP